jgi:superfamily II DNA or RNA helicase
VLKNYQCDLLIVDEVHHSAAFEFRKALEIPSSSRMGLSATIEGEEKTRILERELGKRVFLYTIRDAIRDKIIPEFKWHVKLVPLSIEETEEYQRISEELVKLFSIIKRDRKTIKALLDAGGNRLRKLVDQQGNIRTIKDFIDLTEIARYHHIHLPDDWHRFSNLLFERRRIIHKSVPKRDAAIELIKARARTQKCVVFTMDILSCGYIAEAVRAAGITAYECHSDQTYDENRQSLTDFRKCIAGALISPKILDEGIDIPDAEIGINVASTKSRLQLVQRIGRILRKGKGNKKPEFFHFVPTIDEDIAAALRARKDMLETDSGELLSQAAPRRTNLVFDEGFELLDEIGWVTNTAGALGSDLIFDEDVEQHSEILLAHSGLANDVKRSIVQQKPIYIGNIDRALSFVMAGKM